MGSSLYRDQKAVLEMQEKRGKAGIKKGVRQGCSLSPPLSNLYSEEAIDRIKGVDLCVTFEKSIFFIYYF